MDEENSCDVCTERLGSRLSLKWMKFLQNFDIQNNNIFLCDFCIRIILKMKRLTMILLSKDKECIENKTLHTLDINKLDSIDISPIEKYIKDEEMYVNDFDNGNDDVDCSTEEIIGENISESNAYNLNFEVTYLTLEEQRSEILFKKKSVKFKNMLFKCEKCGIGFVSHEAYKDHNLRHEDDTAIHICPICHLHFKSHLVLSQHKLSHKRRFRCLLCGVTYKRWAHALAHRAQCGTDPCVAKCDQCNKIFYNQYSLDIHKKIHTRKERYLCDECSKCFSTKQHLIIHLRTHTGAKPFKCIKCDKSFTTNSNLTTHKLVHTEDKSFYCVECDKNFKTEKSLKRHLATSSMHIEEKIYVQSRYSCSDCLKSFTTPFTLSTHRRNAHLSIFKCEICDKIFSSNSNLKKHLKIHAKR